MLSAVSAADNFPPFFIGDNMNPNFIFFLPMVLAAIILSVIINHFYFVHVLLPSITGAG